MECGSVALGVCSVECKHDVGTWTDRYTCWYNQQTTNGMCGSVCVHNAHEVDAWTQVWTDRTWYGKVILATTKILHGWLQAFWDGMA